MAKLRDLEIPERMPKAHGWDRYGDMLIRTWKFPSPRLAREFVNQAGTIAERLDHYPDIILNHRSVRIELNSRLDGGLTDRDFELATELNGISVED